MCLWNKDFISLENSTALENSTPEDWNICGWRAHTIFDKFRGWSWGLKSLGLECHSNFLKSYFLAQIDGYEKGDNGRGWFMWTGKTENNSGPEWDFIFLTENGIIPEDLCNRPTYCNY